MRKIARVFFKDISTLNKVILTFQELQEEHSLKKKLLYRIKHPIKYMVFQGKKYQMNEKYVCSLVTKISAKSSLSIADTKKYFNT